MLTLGQLAAALALGAQGVNMGTAFMVMHEAEIHPNIKQAMVKADERQTTHIFTTLHNTARVYKNKVAQEVVALEKRPGGCEFKDISHVRRSVPPRIEHIRLTRDGAAGFGSEGQAGLRDWRRRRGHLDGRHQRRPDQKGAVLSVASRLAPRTPRSRSGATGQDFLNEIERDAENIIANLARHSSTARAKL